MATLTTSYQMLAQKYLGNSYGNLYVRVYAKYTEQDIANNRTKVQYEARAYFSGSYIYDASGAGKISGTSATSVSGSCTKPTEGETVIATTTAAWVTHGSNGKKSISASAYLNFPNWGWSGTATGTADLPAIPRQAVINSAQNFSDEGNTTITYTNSAGSSVSSLQAGISFDGTTFQVTYRDVSKTGTSYTFELTDAERTALRNACTTANSRTVYFYLKTVISGTTYTNKFAKTFSVVNASPTLSATAKDTNSTTTALTGDANKIIKGFNTVSVTATATALKGATIKSYKITNGGKSLTTSSGTFRNVESGTFVFSVTDSRGNTTSVTLEKTLINYVVLTTNLSAGMAVDDANGTITATIKGKYFNGSFGSKSNTLTVQYRYKTIDGTYGSWTSATATKSGNTYTASVSITKLDYKKKYVIQARATDKLATIKSVEITLNCLPVFDWGESNFNFNVPVTFQEQNIEKQGSYVHYTVGESGVAGYINIAQIVCKGDYANTPIILHVLQRDAMKNTYSIRFMNDSSNDPSISAFTYEGNRPAYLVKTDTSTWDLYIQKTDKYDAVCVTQLENSYYVNSKFDITWKDTQVTDLPDGYKESTNSTKYRLSQILGTTYKLETSVVAGSNWTISDPSAYLVGNTLRLYFKGTRSSSLASGNVTNETVVTFTITHNGKINGIYNVTSVNGLIGGVVTFNTTDTSISDDTLSVSVMLTAASTAVTEVNTQIALPVTLNMDAYF